jgi:hypothetical protein
LLGEGQEPNGTCREAPRRRRLEEMSLRRFPPSWTAEETEAHFIVRDATG